MLLAPNQEKGTTRMEVKNQKVHLMSKGSQRVLNKSQGAWILDLLCYSPLQGLCQDKTWGAGGSVSAVKRSFSQSLASLSTLCL